MSVVEGSMVSELIARLDQAVAIQEECVCCHAVKDVLHEIVESGGDFVPSEFLKPAEGCYARRLLYRDPKDRYTVLVMVWDKGQGTALHDHAGVWCVECVYRGRIDVVSYSLDAEPTEGNPLYQFSPEQKIVAGIGDAGALIPPFEYHTIANPDETPAVTIHVYGGELTWCHAFLPEEGGFRQVRKELAYTS